MRKIGKLRWLLFMLVPLMVPTASLHAQLPSEGGEEEETILVGHIAHIEGQLLRYAPDEKDWVPTVKDAPFGINDTLHSDKGGRAEILIPNNTWVRIDGDSQIQLIVLKDDLTEIEVPSGVARFYNKGSYALVKAGTPFGHVIGPAETIFDLNVGDASVEVIAMKGTVYFVHATTRTKIEVTAGSASILADSRHVTAGEGRGDPGWDGWNRDRDTLWAERMQLKGKSAEYLPSRLNDHAYVLEENGKWERMYYDGAYSYFWRPLYVSVGWVPFTVGRWTVWYGEHTWLPYEPFGYVTHHYGHWVFLRHFWYWAPPVARIRARTGRPALNIAFAWYPGRVAWIHSGVNVGWFPLDPHEPYYCYRRWGPHAVIVKNVRIASARMGPRKYRHFTRAVIINRNNLYRAHGYRNFMIKNVKNASLTKNYRVTPVLKPTITQNYKNIGSRHHVTDGNLTRKAPWSIRDRIKQNKLIIKQRAAVKAKPIRPNLTNMRPRGPADRTRIRPIEVKNKSLPVHRTKRPVSRVRVEQKAAKGKEELQAKGRGQPRTEIQGRQKKISPKSVKGQAVRKSQVNARVKGALPRAERQVQRTQERQRTRQGQQVQLRTKDRQGQQARHGNIEKYQGRGFGAFPRATRPRSQSGTARQWVGRRHLNN